MAWPRVATRLVAAALLLVAAPSASASGSRIIDSAETGNVAIASDGARWIAYNRSADTVRLYDLDDGGHYEIATACRVADGYAGHFLLTCGDQGRPYLLRPPSRSLTAVPGWDESRAESFWRIGRQWLQGSQTTGPAPDVVYLNWHTGAHRFARCGCDDRDIDGGALGRMPGARSQGWYGSSGAFYLMSDRLTDRDELSLYPRDGGRRRVIARCHDFDCSAPRLSAGVATWSRDGHAYAYDIARGWRRSWPANGMVVHTRHHVAFVHTDSPFASNPSQIDVAPMFPRRRQSGETHGAGTG